MKRPIRSSWFKRITASVLLVTYSVGCTHMPSGEKAFDSFESCFASNLGLAALGGIGAGFLSAKLTQQLTDKKSTANAVGATAGIAAATMIAMTAWRKCAAVYSTSEPIARPPEPTLVQVPARTTRQPSLNLDRLDVRLDGTENDPPVPEFDFSYFAENPATKDVKAKFRHKVEIVRFKPDNDDKLILADERGEALLDSSGKTIPLEAAVKIPRERLQWVTIADEGKEDYVEDVVIQQGQRTSYRHRLQIPPRAQMPLPLPVPMRYTLSVEADGMKSMRTVDFALLGNAGRPKRFSATQAVNAGSGNGVTAARSLVSSASGFVATHFSKRKVSLYSEAGPNRKVVASLPKGAKVRVDDQAQVEQNRRQVKWAKVISEKGAGGWLMESELAGVK